MARSHLAERAAIFEYLIEYIDCLLPPCCFSLTRHETKMTSHRSIDMTQLSNDEAYRLLTGCVIPRPIALVSTVSETGTANLAPFSFFNLVSTAPPTVVVSVDLERGAEKDTSRNIRATGQFVVNLVTQELAEQMVHASLEWPEVVDEFIHSGFNPVPSSLVTPPRVADSPVNLECRSVAAVELGESTAFFGEIVIVHVDESALEGDYKVQPERLDAVGRLAGIQYCTTRDVREIVRNSKLAGSSGSGAQDRD